MPRLKPGNFTANGWPELHGPAVKAANTRKLLPYAVSLQRRAVELIPSESNRHALKAAQSLHTVIEIMYGGSYFFDNEELQNLQGNLARLGQNYQRLAVLSADEGVLGWKMTIQLHYLVAHLGHQAALLNPRFTQTYASEGLVGKVCNIYKRNQSGPFLATVQSKVLGKYTLGLCIDFGELLP